MDSLKFKIRCSAISQIMTNPRSKKDKDAGILSATSKTFVKNWVLEQRFGRRKEFSSKQTEKGITVENGSIDFLIKNDLLMFAEKNVNHFENEFLTGTPDIIQPLEVIDVKNSWDLFTFPHFDTEIKNKSYWWQLQGYMELTGKDSARLIYILSNTPEHLIEREIYYATKDFDLMTESEFKEIEEKTRHNHIFDDITPHERVRIFKVEKDDEAIEKIKNRVAECQNYINELKF